MQQHAHHFWLAFVCTISPLIPNAILTRLSLYQCKGIRELCLVRHSLVSVQFVRVLILVRRNTTQCGFNSRSSLHRSDQPPILLHPLFSSIEEMSFSGQTQTKKSLLSLLIFPAIRGNHYLIDRHGYPPYFFLLLVDDG